MTKNKVYTLPWDDVVKESFEKLQKKFAPNERLISTAVHDNKFIVTTEVVTETVSEKKQGLLLG